MPNTALVVGATGIIGSALARHLIAEGWATYGLSRTAAHADIAGLHPVAADLLDPASLAKALAEVAPTHVFLAIWMRNATEKENIRVNSALVRNVLDALSAKRSVQHVGLVTGLKHYLGPFDAYASSGTLPETPLREEQPRLPLENFYYAQEDEVYAAAKRDGFGWTVHRPHTIVGRAVGNLMNIGSTLAAYAAICKETGRKFQFPGSAAQWNGLSDVTDARVLAKQLVWAATSPAARNEAFNIVNGEIFRWKWLWPRLAARLGVEAAGFDGTVHPLEAQMANDAPVWRQIAAKHGLAESDLSRLASPWHTDLDLGRPIEVMTDMTKARKAGFLAYQSTEDSFFDLFATLRAEKLIP